MIFKTMTVGGIYGKEYEIVAAHNDALIHLAAEEASQRAEADGYEVLDVMDDILVIADGA